MKNILFAALTLLTLIAFVYAFFQQTAAERAKLEAELNAKAAIEARAIADQNAELFRNEAIKLRDSLKKCKGR